MTFSQFFQQNIFLFFLLAAVIGAIIVVEWQSRGKGGQKISQAQTVQRINRGATLIDLRGDAAFKAGHIAGAISIPSGSLSKGLARIKTGKDHPVVVYDDNGFQVSEALKILSGAGFLDIAALDQGFNGWIEENLPVVK